MQLSPMRLGKYIMHNILA